MSVEVSAGVLCRSRRDGDGDGDVSRCVEIESVGNRLLQGLCNEREMMMGWMLLAVRETAG